MRRASQNTPEKIVEHEANGTECALHTAPEHEKKNHVPQKMEKVSM
jgi:hypothetical protein